jgi:hypothetical protein
MAVGRFVLPISAGGSYSKVVQVYTSSGTWTKPTGLTHIEVICIGGGGGGASGRQSGGGQIVRGGCGGGAASIAWGSFTESELSATEDYTVGAGGVGGAAQTSGDGLDGTAGGNSFFSGTDFATSKVFAEGGNFGTNTAAGATRLSTGLKPTGLPGLVGATSNASGTAGAAATAENTSTAFNLLRGGGGGGGVTAAAAVSAGGSGARYYNKAGTLSSVNGGAVDTAGGDGADGQMNRFPFNLGDGNYSGITQGYGCPGGGGGSSTSSSAGRGGDGGNYGGAGGGGGAAQTGAPSGRGGNGGAGVVIVIEHIVS